MFLLLYLDIDSAGIDAYQIGLEWPGWLCQPGEKEDGGGPGCPAQNLAVAQVKARVMPGAFNDSTFEGAVGEVPAEMRAAVLGGVDLAPDFRQQYFIVPGHGHLHLAVGQVGYLCNLDFSYETPPIR
jgi:hypothetical protein